MDPYSVSGIGMVITTIWYVILKMILYLVRLTYPSGFRRIWHALGESLVLSGTISSCDMITCISHTSLGVVISYATGEMIVISRYAYFYSRYGGSVNLIVAGTVLDQDSS